MRYTKQQSCFKNLRKLLLHHTFHVWCTHSLSVKKKKTVTHKPGEFLRKQQYQWKIPRHKDSSVQIPQLTQLRSHKVIPQLSTQLLLTLNVPISERIIQYTAKRKPILSRPYAGYLNSFQFNQPNFKTFGTRSYEVWHYRTRLVSTGGSVHIM